MPNLPGRTSGTSSMGLPGLKPATKWLLIVVAAMSILPLLLDRWGRSSGFGEELALYWGDLRAGHVWQLLTYGLTHYNPVVRALDPFGLAIALLMLWMFGGQVEAMLGRRRYLGFAAASIVGAGVFALLLERPLFGAHVVHFSSWPLQEALIAYWALSMPEMPVYFMFAIPLKAKHLLYISLAITLLSLINSGAAMLAPLGGIAMGALFAKAPLSPRVTLLKARHWWLSRRRRSRMRPFEVIPGKGKDEFLH